jgi:sulfur relay protein TusB/DsrH
LNLYLVDRELSATAKALVREDKDALVVLVQDGVYVDIADIPAEIKVYALAEDLRKRGMPHPKGNRLNAITYDELVDLVVEHRINNFA